MVFVRATFIDFIYIFLKDCFLRQEKCRVMVVCYFVRLWRSTSAQSLVWRVIFLYLFTPSYCSHIVAQLPSSFSLLYCLGNFLRHFSFLLNQYTFSTQRFKPFVRNLIRAGYCMKELWMSSNNASKVYNMENRVNSVTSPSRQLSIISGKASEDRSASPFGGITIRRFRIGIRTDWHRDEGH